MHRREQYSPIIALAFLSFLVARYLGFGFVDRARLASSAGPARLATLLHRAERGGWRMVAVVRLVPIVPHSLTNYALGLTGLRLGAYAVGSLLGQLPMTIAYADLGAAGGQGLLGGLAASVRDQSEIFEKGLAIGFGQHQQHFGLKRNGDFAGGDRIWRQGLCLERTAL